jgi:HEAT repeat protein
MINDKCKRQMMSNRLLLKGHMPLPVTQIRLVIFALLSLFLATCAPSKRVWYQEDISDLMMKSDLEACGTEKENQNRLALCMRGKGYVFVPNSVAELLKVRTLQEEGLNADEIAQRLQWEKNKVARYLDEDYELPRTTSLGRQPIEVSTKIGKPAVKPLIADLKDNDPIVRSHAAQALGVIKDPRAVEPLIAILNDEEPLIQRQAIKALRKIDDPRALNPIITVLNDKNRESYVRMSAADALGRFGDFSGVEALVAALNAEHWEVRSHAAKALGRLKDPRAVEPLIESLQDEDATVRGYVVDALAEINDPRAIEPLVVALKDKNKSVRKKAARALRRIAGQDF